MSNTDTTEEFADETQHENQSHVLVDEAFDLMEQKLDQDELTTEDMVEVYEALDEAYNHPDSDIWVTLTALGPKNQCIDHLPDNDRDPMLSPRDQLRQIVDHEIKVTVS